MKTCSCCQQRPWLDILLIMSTCLSERKHVVRLPSCCLQINQWDDHDIFGELLALLSSVTLHCCIPLEIFLGDLTHTQSQCRCVGLQMAGEAIQTTCCSVLSFKVAVLATLHPPLDAMQNIHHSCMRLGLGNALFVAECRELTAYMTDLGTEAQVHEHHEHVCRMMS